MQEKLGKKKIPHSRGGFSPNKMPLDLSFCIQQLVSFFKELHDDFIIVQGYRTNGSNFCNFSSLAQTSAGFTIVFFEGLFIGLHIQLGNKKILYFARLDIVFVDQKPGFLAPVTESKHAVEVDEVLYVDGGHNR